MPLNYFRGIRLSGAASEGSASGSQNISNSNALAGDHQGSDFSRGSDFDQRSERNSPFKTEVERSMTSGLLTPSEITFLSDQSRRGLLKGPNPVRRYLKLRADNEKPSAHPFAGSTFENSAPRPEEFSPPPESWMDSFDRASPVPMPGDARRRSVSH